MVDDHCFCYPTSLALLFFNHHRNDCCCAWHLSHHPGGSHPPKSIITFSPLSLNESSCTNFQRSFFPHNSLRRQRRILTISIPIHLYLCSIRIVIRHPDGFWFWERIAFIYCVGVFGTCICFLGVGIYMKRRSSKIIGDEKKMITFHIERFPFCLYLKNWVATGVIYCWLYGKLGWTRSHSIMSGMGFAGVISWLALLCMMSAFWEQHLVFSAEYWYMLGWFGLCWLYLWADCGGWLRCIYGLVTSWRLFDVTSCHISMGAKRCNEYTDLLL